MPTTARHRSGVEVTIPHDDRRQFVRRPFDEKIGWSFDGDRLYTRSENVSAGGIFLRMDDGTSLPVGALVGIVYTTGQLGVLPTRIFLFGRVVRVQTYPRAGIGLAWERAVTAGSCESLKSFLSSFLRIHDPAVIEEPWGQDGAVRSVFVFPAADFPEDGTQSGPSRSSASAEPEAPPAPRPGSPSRQSAPAGEGRPLDGNGPPRTDRGRPKKSSIAPDRPFETGRAAGRSAPILPLEPDEKPRPMPSARSPARPAVAIQRNTIARPADTARPAARRAPSHPLEPIPGLEPLAVPPPGAPVAVADPLMVAWAHYIAGRQGLPSSSGSPGGNPYLSLPDFQALVSIPATLIVGPKRVAVRILRLGASSMFLGTQLFAVDRSVPVKVSFEFGVACDAWSVDCSCHIVDVEDGMGRGATGFGLHVTSFDDPDSAGILSRYVRFLHHQAYALT